MQTIHIMPIKAFQDNYIWCFHDTQNAIVVDPGAADPVISMLNSQGFKLTGILITHWHFDHIGGVEKLLSFSQCPVYGPDSSKIDCISEIVTENDTINLLGCGFEIITVPGHTLDHIAFFCADYAWLFCGDTLFAGGCGRMFEGSAKMFYASLQKLVKLPRNTQIFCAHEYTLNNLAFAETVEPDNQDIKKRIMITTNTLSDKGCSLPSTIDDELKTNPFIRVDNVSVIESALNQGAQSSNPIDIFAALREWKNHF